MLIYGIMCLNARRTSKTSRGIGVQYKYAVSVIRINSGTQNVVRDNIIEWDAQYKRYMINIHSQTRRLNAYQRILLAPKALS